MLPESSAPATILLRVRCGMAAPFSGRLDDDPSVFASTDARDAGIGLPESVGPGPGAGLYLQYRTACGRLAVHLGREHACGGAAGSIGNDLSTPLPQCRFPGLVRADRWCVTAANWLRARWECTGGDGIHARAHRRCRRSRSAQGARRRRPRRPGQLVSPSKPALIMRNEQVGGCAGCGRG
jgi:uncharacterized protein